MLLLGDKSSCMHGFRAEKLRKQVTNCPESEQPISDRQFSNAPSRYNGAVAAGQFAVFQGVSEAPISGLIRAERVTRKNSRGRFRSLRDARSDRAWAADLPGQKAGSKLGTIIASSVSSPQIGSPDRPLKQLRSFPLSPLLNVL